MNSPILDIAIISSIEILARDDILCNAGSESNYLFILISGSLQAILNDGSKFSRISPLWTIGEMGVFSGEKRSATVIAETDCMLLSIQKIKLFNVLRNDPMLGQIVLMNINNYLSNKLRLNQAIIEELKALCTHEEYSRILSRILSESDG